MSDRQICIGCAKESPETNTNYTLISAQFGWRLSRQQGADGMIIVEWRCPECWRELKKAKEEQVPKSGLRSASVRPPHEPRRTEAAPVTMRGRGFFESAVHELKRAIRSPRSEPPRGK